MWSRNKDTIKWAVGLFGSALIAWGVAKTKISALENEIATLKPTVIALQIELAKTQTELKDLKEFNQREFRELKHKNKGSK